MTLYVLDTDHTTLLGHGHPTVVARLQEVPIARRAITVITVEEHLRAWFTQVRKSLPRLGKHDLSIAAIVLEYDGTLVTRNRQDFEQVPNLHIQDWSV